LGIRERRWKCCFWGKTVKAAVNRRTPNDGEFRNGKQGVYPLFFQRVGKWLVLFDLAEAPKMRVWKLQKWRGLREGVNRP
jgi:hypothetical protein